MDSLALWAEDIREALSLHKHSLRTLYLDLHDYDHWDSFAADNIVSLNGFSNLTHLHVVYPRLVGIGSENVEHNLSAILPSAIEMLSLDYAFDKEWGHEVHSDLIHLAQSGLQACPALTVVSLRETNVNGRGWRDVKNVFESRGLDLRKCDWHNKVKPLSDRQWNMKEQWLKLRQTGH